MIADEASRRPTTSNAEKEEEKGRNGENSLVEEDKGKVKIGESRDLQEMSGQ